VIHLLVSLPQKVRLDSLILFAIFSVSSLFVESLLCDLFLENLIEWKQQFFDVNISKLGQLVARFDMIA